MNGLIYVVKKEQENVVNPGTVNCVRPTKLSHPPLFRSESQAGD